MFDGSPLLHAPGTAFEYSSLGTVLLGAAMSDAAGVPFRKLIEREVLVPAGMTSTYADGDKDERSRRLTTLYYTDGERFRLWELAGASHFDTYGLIAPHSDDGRLRAVAINSR